MKKAWTLLLSLLLLCSLVACDSSTPPVVPSVEEGSPQQGASTPSSGNQTPSSGNNTPTEEPDDGWLKIATYNIVRCEDQTDKNKTTRPENIINFIDEYDIDIIGLNEVDVNNARSMGSPRDEYYTKYGSHQPKYIAEKLTEQTGEPYYWTFAAGLDGYHSPANSALGNAQYGNAIISKYPIKSTRSILIAAHEIDPDNPKTQVAEGSYERRVLLFAEIEVDGEIITVISTHFGLKEEERELAVQRLQNELPSIDTPVIFMGDLNASYNSTIIQSLNLLLKPTSTAAKPGTFVSSGSRIDYIFTSEDIVTKDLKVPNVLYSDHYPVIVKAMLKEAET